MPVGACGAECACGVDRCSLAEGALWDSAAGGGESMKSGDY